MAELTVVICSHHFLVKNITPRSRPAVETFARRYVQYGLVRERGRYHRAALKVFAAATQSRSEYRFHINTLKEFRAHIEATGNWLTEALVDWSEKPIPASVAVELPIHDCWETRDYQEPVIEYIVDPAPPRSKFVALQTGKGKSYCAMRSGAQIGKRICLIVRPMYLDKWMIDLKKTYNFDMKEHVLVVQGSEQLQALLVMAKEGRLEGNKIIMVSNKTMQNYIKLYEQHGDYILELGYECTPENFFEHLGVGNRWIDEVHQDFHLNFKIDLYTHVEHSVSLSATLLSDDDFLNRMYEIAYPKSQQYKGPAYDKYIDARAIIYKLKHPNKMRTQEYGSKTYSHHVFEKSVMRNSELQRNYLDMINQCIKGTFLKNYEPGHKLLVYCASIDFCTIVTSYLRQQYPRMDVRRYVEEDPYDNLMESDIRVTTLQSAGTGVDILNLTTTILTVAVSSSQSNIQGFGRLRKLPEHITKAPQFLYFVCEDIPKHIEYHERKRELLKDRALVYKAEYIGMPI